MSQPSGLVKRPSDVPANFNDWQRTLKSDPQLNDQVEALMPEMVKQQLFRTYINGTTDDDCVEGSMAIDNAKAAEMIRDYVRKQDVSHPLATKKLSVLSKALNVVMKRYNYSRKQRRQMVGGQMVPDEHHNPE
jgi:hypothetical protein